MSPPLTYGALGANSRVHVEGDGVVVDDAAGAERVRLGRLSDGNYGLRVQNPAGTVIIDGTSNMFRILASGTLTSGSMADATDTTVETTLTGLGTFAAIPAFVAFSDDENTNAGGRFIGRQLEYFNPMWVSSASGGGTTVDVLSIADSATVSVYLNGSSLAVVRLRSFNRSNTTKTFYGKYHVMSETAI